MIRALLVDDHALLRRVVRRLLERSGEVEVVGEAGDGAEAVQQTQDLEPDVVLLDFLLPQTNALELLRKLKELPSSPQIVMLTALDSTRVKELALAAGASAFVPKKLAHLQLVQTIKLVAKRS